MTITGSDFATDPVTGAPPTVTLGGTPLTDVAYVDSTTLNATVPWGMDPGTYDLTVVNPDGAPPGSLTAAFTVDQGIGRWNGGDLFGGDVHQSSWSRRLQHPLRSGVRGRRPVPQHRCRRAVDATSATSVALGNDQFAVDPQGWLYGYAYDGLYRSQDEGDSWTKIMTATPGRTVSDSTSRRCTSRPSTLRRSSSAPPTSRTTRIPRAPRA